ncbi:MAG: hypothetical protein ACI9WU_002705, partial [Myxococcota bacterium]
VVDGAVMDIARTAMQLQDNRAMMVRPIYNLWRDDRELAAPLMDLLSLKAPSLDDSGPFDLDDRVAGLEEEMCGVDEALEQDMIDDVPTDDKAARLRALVMTATDQQLAILDAHDSGPNAGATSRALAYRRCEIMLKRTDVTDVADESARKGAAGQAIRCLSRHLTRYKSHGDAGLELARVLDDVGQEGAAVMQLKRLVVDSEDRVRVLAGYRLLSKALSNGVETLGLGKKGIRALKRAAKTVMAEGHTPHQAIVAEMVLAWAESLNQTKPTAAFERMASLLNSVRDSKTGKSLFVDQGALIDVTNKLAVAAGVPAGQLVTLYRDVNKSARTTAMLQLAHIYARRGEVDNLKTIAAGIRGLGKDQRAELVLVLAELEELAPQAGGEGDATPVFDKDSATAAAAALERLVRVAQKSTGTLSNSAACAAYNYADQAAEALVEAGLLDQAAEHLRMVLSVVPESHRIPVALRLADVEDMRGETMASATLYARVLTRDVLNDYALHLIDYYQVAVRADSESHRANASKLVAERIESLLSKAATTFEADEAMKRDVFVVVHDLLRAEGHFQALLSAAGVYATLGADDLAAMSCTGGNHGLFVGETAKAGFEEHFAGRDRMCVDATVVATDAAARRHMAAAAEFAEAGLICAADVEMATPFAVDGAEAYRLMGDLSAAESLLASATARFGASEEIGNQTEVLGWSALLTGDRQTAERLLAGAGTTAGAGYAGFLAMSDKRFGVASEYFTRAARAEGIPGDNAMLWLARTRKSAGDNAGHLAALSQLVKRVKKPEATFAYELAFELYTAGQNPALVARVETQLARLSKKAPRAANFRALVRAERYLAKYFVPAAEAEYSSVNGAAKRYVKLTSKMYAELAKRVGPALDAPRGEEKPLMGTLIPAAEVLARGLFHVRGFLERHEGISDDEQWATLVVTELDRLGAEVAGMADATLGMANAGGYNDPALEDYTKFLVASYPDLFAPTRAHAFLCEDERPTVAAAPDATSAAGAAWSRVAENRLAEARLVASECVAGDAMTETEQLALSFATARGIGPGEMVGAPAAALSRQVADGAQVGAEVLRALAGHYAGVDCDRTVNLVDTAGDAPFALGLSAAACRGDQEMVMSMLRDRAQSNPDARTLRRLAQVEMSNAQTDDDVKKVESLLQRSAELAGLSRQAAQAADICELPRS